MLVLSRAAPSLARWTPSARVALLAIRLFVGGWLVIWPRAGSAQQSTESAAAIRAYVQEKLARQPGEAAGWRMLGKIHWQAGELPQALAALERAAQLDRCSAAAQCDLGVLLMQMGRHAEAVEHLQQTIALAPESEYAEQARDGLQRLPAPIADEKVAPASYEIRRFDGSDSQEKNVDLADQVGDSFDRWSIRVESGALYNTNVTLTPTSRELTAGEAASAQGFFNPELEYLWLDSEVWRGGLGFVGYFSVNERPFNDLNLQSYQPGVFVERSIELENVTVVPKLKYDFAFDEFREATFGRRHALTAALLGYWNDGDLSLLYCGGDYSDFADDGVNPATSSRDGWTNSLGASHEYFYGLPHLALLRLGGEVQWADSEGSDFTYRGISLYAATEHPLRERWLLTLEGSWGFRDYYQFNAVPSRDENIFRAATRLEYRWSEHWSLAGVFTYDRFDSENELFAASRYVTGLVTVFEY